ncbi:hypothetical protein COL68_26995 [Bacillus wiedmannii]|nr:hypothetical protein CN557_27935 [Bacillus wiedmannii]PFZ01162.1 hypothetical protein COL57_01305 [Bacillus wiedmannii]PFZ52536.1 hypothetical protein COL68_26995 [Bacillus wiedmannii]PGB74500.1 hypothetical protein COM03_24365 [Bacillus wiedmannii]PGD98226.1 hypothetical protein COM48_06105 [Bacillus wiedmannii]
MISEKVIGFNPIFITQVTSLIFKKGMTTLYEGLSNRVTNKKQLAKANCSVVQGGARRKSKVIYILTEY